MYVREMSSLREVKTPKVAPVDEYLLLVIVLKVKSLSLELKSGGHMLELFADSDLACFPSSDSLASGAWNIEGSRACPSIMSIQSSGGVCFSWVKIDSAGYQTSRMKHSRLPTLREEKRLFSRLRRKLLQYFFSKTANCSERSQS